MKKGEVSLEALVKLIPHVLISFGLMAVLVVFVSSFFYKEKSPAEQDFYRILMEFEDLKERGFYGDDCVRVPVQPKSPLQIALYSKDSPVLPGRCQKQACVCLYEDKGNQKVETCKGYPDVDVVCDFRKPLCFKSPSPPLSLNVGDTVVTVVRSSSGFYLAGPSVRCEAGRLA